MGNAVTAVIVRLKAEGVLGGTDAEGRLNVEIPAGTVKLHLEAEKDDAEAELGVRFGEDGSADTDTENDGLSLQIEGQIQAGTTVTLLILDEQGNPVPDAEVRIKMERDAGLTSAEGLLDIEIPAYAEELSLEARLGDRRGELEREFTVAEPQASTDGDGSDEEGDVGETGLTVQLEGLPQAGTEVTTGDVTSEGALAAAPGGDGGDRRCISGADGSPVFGAEIRVNGEVVGTTNADGVLTITIPQNAEELEIKASVSGSEGELKLSIQ